MSAQGRAPRSGRRGLRREMPLLLPVAVALLGILGITIFVGYRVAIERFALERRDEALGLAQRLIDGGPEALRAAELQRRLYPGAAVAVVGPGGESLVAIGVAGEEALPAALLERARAGEAVAWGPDRLGRPAVVALAPIPESGGRLLRVELPAHALAAQRRALALLTPIAIVVTVAVSLLVALSFRALLRPYDAVLARARALEELGGGEPHGGREGRDEADFLIATFDRALATLGAPDGDLAPLAGTLGRSVDGGFLLLDRTLDLLVMTPAAAELLEIDSPAPGSNLEEAFAPLPGAAAELTAALGAGTSVPRGALRVAEGPPPRTVGFTAEPLRGEGGRPRGWLVVLADLTEHERREARERLAEGLAQLGELAAGVAHEMRNGLGALAGWVALARRSDSAAERTEYLGEIERESRELTRVVEEFLAFARPGTHRIERLDLAALARRVAAAGAGDGIEVVVDAPQHAVEVDGDPGLLERALRNLVVNAARATRDAAAREPVRIVLEPAGNSWSVTVLDRGAGIPAEIRPRLFEPFATGRADGVGLGLALARRIVLLHGGEIALSDRAGGGTAAKVVLPAGKSDTVRNDPAV